jgi:hypothetical protein
VVTRALLSWPRLRIIQAQRAQELLSSLSFDFHIIVSLRQLVGRGSWQAVNAAAMIWLTLMQRTRT